MVSAEKQFASWLNATMRTRGMTQASFARQVGVADAQVSRWRRGHVTPTVRSLQRIAETLEVPRTTLDRLAGYPIDAMGSADVLAGTPESDPAKEAELQTYQVELGRVVEQKVPAHLRRAYVEACRALAESLASSFQEALATATEAHASDDPSPPPAGEDSASKRGPSLGFRRR
jgi:transcriptional regulator with XRE-family HTH domain